MCFSLTLDPQQTVVITGGSEGMGKAVACQLAAKGANIVIVARTVQKLQGAIEDIKVSICPSYSSVDDTHHPSARLWTPASKNSTSSAPT